MTEQDKERQRQLIEIAKRNPQKLNLEPYKPKNSEWIDCHWPTIVAMPTVRPVRRIRRSRQLGMLKLCTLKGPTFAAITAILIRFINTTLENMTEKQRENMFALVDSRTKVNNEIAIQLAKGLGDDAFVKQVAKRIYTHIAKDLHVTLCKYSIMMKHPIHDLCMTFVDDIRNQPFSFAKQCVAEYILARAMDNDHPIDTVNAMPFEPIPETYELPEYI